MPDLAGDTGTPAARSGPSDEGRGVARNMLRKFRGKAEDAIAYMADENRAMRDQRRDDREKLKAFEGPDVIVLKGDDLKAYNEYKALGKPDELKTKLAELPALQSRVQNEERRTSAADAAKHIAGWNPEALAGLAADKGLDISLVDGQDKDGKAIKVPHVKVASDANAKPVPATEWVKSQPAYVLAALTAKAPGGAAGAQGAHTGTTGTQFVDQSAAGGTAQTGAGTAKPIPGRAKYQSPGQRAAEQKTQQ